jgi:hypothetical protein
MTCPITLLKKLSFERGTMMKSFSVWELIQIAISCVLFLVPLGCNSYDQMGETTAEGHRRHERTLRINNQELMEDIDTFMLYDRPSKLTEKRIP